MTDDIRAALSDYAERVRSDADRAVRHAELAEIAADLAWTCDERRALPLVELSNVRRGLSPADRARWDAVLDELAATAPELDDDDPEDPEDPEEDPDHEEDLES